MKKIILASQSPRRKELLEQIGLAFEVFPSNVDEHMQNNRSIQENIEELALKKARSVAKNIQEDAIVIGADTIVLIDEVTIGKPKNRDDAKSILGLLSGQTHQVITGLGLIDIYTGQWMTSHQTTYVTMKHYGTQEIEGYINSGECWDKAGSYGIQGLGALLVKDIQGDYFNVVGLPIGLLDDLLKKFNYFILR